MNLFINDTYVKLVAGQVSPPQAGFDVALDLIDQVIKYNQLRGQVLLQNMRPDQAQELIQLLMGHKFEDIACITIQSPNYTALKTQIKNSFKILKAAGGVVSQAQSAKLLLIHRLGKWDFPKGKLEEGEKFKVAAVREVEEECHIKVARGKRLTTTWHNYTQGRTEILKQTRWYEMQCLDDSQMKPQTEEDIDQIAWMEPNEAQAALVNSYQSIQFVLRTFLAYRHQAR
ncbi:MAG: NUDIX hydrolase [Microscillaceae bacterium]|nr:NUDIX hydrolase [Microscillaceae bacterium]